MPTNPLHQAGHSWLRLFRPLAMILGLSLLAACGTGGRGGSIPYDVELGRPDTPDTFALSEDYRIAPLDTLKITVFQVEELSGEYEVDLTGRIPLPLIGDIKAVDLTTAQLDEKLTLALSEKYLQNPDVSVGVKQSSTRGVTVDGSVRLPGMHPVRGPMTLIQAIALARGVDETANPRRVAVFRQVDGQRQAAAFDLTEIRRGRAPDPTLQPGDIVVVDGSKIRQLQRDLLNAVPLIGIFNPIL